MKNRLVSSRAPQQIEIKKPERHSMPPASINPKRLKTKVPEAARAVRQPIAVRPATAISAQRALSLKQRRSPLFTASTSQLVALHQLPTRAYSDSRALRFPKETMEAIRRTAAHLKAEAEKSQKNSGYQVDHWEMATLGEILDETGGKLLCSLPAGIETSWISHHLADIYAATNYDLSQLTPQQVEEIQQRHKKKEHPKGISNYFAGPDSMKYSRIHRGIPGAEHELTYVEFTQIAAGKRPHKPWLWIYHIPKWMGEIPVAVGHARANKTRMLVDEHGFPVIDPDTNDPVIQQIGQGDGRQIYVSPITIALIHGCARRVLIQDETQEHYTVAKVHWHHGKPSLEYKNPLQPKLPSTFHVTPIGVALETMKDTEKLKKVSDPVQRYRIAWQSFFFDAISSNHNLVHRLGHDVPAMFGLTVLRAISQVPVRHMHMQSQRRLAVPKSSALTLYSPETKALTIVSDNKAITKARPHSVPTSHGHKPNTHHHKYLSHRPK